MRSPRRARPAVLALSVGLLLTACATGSTGTDADLSGTTYEGVYQPLSGSATTLPVTTDTSTTPPPSTTVPASSTAAPSTSSVPATTAAPRTTVKAPPRTSSSSTPAPKPASTTPAPRPATTATSAYTPVVARKYGTGNATQLISVSSPSAGSTTATLSAWTKTASKGWVKVKGFDGLTAYVGAQGVGNADENHSRTPAGSFTLTFAFGNKSDPGTRLPYHHVDSNDIWVGDSNSKYYNTLQSCPSARISSCGPPSEDLSAIGSLYNYAALIDYNTANSPTGVVPHEGSAFFLHVTNYEPTGGCVAIPQDKVIALLKWLDPAKHPRIVIGVL